jgi:hypothetical protein
VGVELKILIMDVEFDDQFDDWVENVLVRFLFGFGVEVEKSSIFSLILQNQISGESGPGISREQRRKS